MNKTKIWSVRIFSYSWGLDINNLHSGYGFSLFVGPFIIYHQATSGQVAWWLGKFSFNIPLLNKKYSPKRGWQKINL